MNKNEFVNSIKEVVADSTVESTLYCLENPPGRKPSEKLVSQSKWVLQLSEADKAMVTSIITDAVHDSVFGFFCVLDGVRSISEVGSTNELSLYHGSEGNEVLLNDEQGESLHDIFKSI